ncbi:SLC13 family permease [Paraflavisolibacter sp. H34]|uniref:GntP family permease n=1 Tax=Huijunlia imazamoxiresistens TaxID=3127457 RepID=UPI0030183B43
MNAFFIVGTGIVAVLFCIIVLRLHVLISLLFAALVTGLLCAQPQLYQYALHSGMTAAEAEKFSQQAIGYRLSHAFGNTAAKIGLVVIFASLIGSALIKSGAAERIIRSLLKGVGEKNAALAFLSGSFSLAIPIFIDMVYFLMIPLVKSMGVHNPRKLSLYLSCGVGGGVMAHAMIPPTPGPSFVANELSVNHGIMMVMGIIVGILTILCGYIYSVWANKKWDLPLRDTPDSTIEELKEKSQLSLTDLPGLGISLLPVVLPLVLIAGNTVLTLFVEDRVTDVHSALGRVIAFFHLVGESNIALFISAFFALLLLWRRMADAKAFQKVITEAVTSAGMIVLIISAGGAFGQMLQQTGIGVQIGEMASVYKSFILPLAFLITAVVRTSQGSATVAMVTTIGVMKGFSSAAILGFHPVYLALVIGCGSKVFSWMNDSAFWIITEMSGMRERETVRYFSCMLTVMGIAGLVFVMILSKVFPLT